MYDALELAKYVINWCVDKAQKITNLKLQKILYFLQGEYCKITNQRLINDDFYAWQLGPVLPKVYNYFSIYSSSSIPKQNEEVYIGSDTEIINDILIKYTTYTAWELVELSHAQDPWKYNHQIFGDRAIIPYQSIKNYFESGECR